MKKTIIILCLLILTACSSSEMTTINEIMPSKSTKEETIETGVKVHTVIGTGQGKIVASEAGDKWIQTEASLVSQHPFSLVETSNGKLYKATIVYFNIEENDAYLHIKNSIKLHGKIKEKALTFEPLTYKQRLQLQQAFADTAKGEPSAKISGFDGQLFTYNPDKIEAFVHQFEEAFAKFRKTREEQDVRSLVGNDLLLAAMKKIADKEGTPTIKKVNVSSVTIGDMYYTVEAVLTLENDEKMKAIYTLIRTENALKMVGVQYKE